MLLFKQHPSFLLYLLASIPLALAQHPSKRGLVYIPPAQPNDLNPFTNATDLSWYYNYAYNPTSSFPLPFTPMLHSLPTSSSDTTTFTDTLSSLLSTQHPPTHLLTFNEPDQPTSVGGSSISPTTAAKFYIETLLPLRSRSHIKLSWPATSGSAIGLTWLAAFNTACHALNPHHGCPADFLATHYYGPFADMASWLGQLHALHPTLPIWVTEFALPTNPLPETQDSFNASLAYLDRLEYVERYAWFGTFRADNAGGFVGGNVSFLDDGGGLTDLGAWYLGEKGTGNEPWTGIAARPSPCGFMGGMTGVEFILGMLAVHLIWTVWA